VAPEVVVARVTITAPPCAPLLVDVVMVGAAAAVGVGVGVGVGLEPPLLHPLKKAPGTRTAVSIASQILISNSPS
jgi:hypothetical protein